MRATNLLPAALLLIGLSGCAAASPDTTDGASHDTTGDVVAAGRKVGIVDFAYTPPTLEVRTGTAVTWTNRDDFAHTVTAGTPGAPASTFDAPLGDPAAHENRDTTFTTIFDEPGTYAYFCDLHPSMVGEVVVVAGP